MKLIALCLCAWITGVLAQFPVPLSQCTPGSPNIAPKGTAMQCSLYDVRGIPEHAIDGNKNPTYGGQSCSHTQSEFGPWWRLDLQESHAINVVIITNRADCCSEHLRGVEVRVGDSLDNNGIANSQCAPQGSVDFPGPTIQFCCNGLKGRYVTVTIPSRKDYLSLCEVEVFGSVIGGQIPGQILGGQNIAVKGIATQSSVYDYKGVPEHAIDGNNDANYGGLSCIHTQLEFSPWWRLDFLERHSINTVIITNRADCCSERLSGVQVQVGDSPVTSSQCTPLDSVDFPGPTLQFSCNGWTGRYITVIIPNRVEYLSLCEVEVFGSVIHGQVPGQIPGHIPGHIPGGQNIALKGVATQSSVYDYRGVPEHAIDGNNDANYGGLSCTHTQLEFSPWWRLDLQDSHAINNVIITNRADCCSERLSGVKVWVGDSLDIHDITNLQCTPCDSVDFPGPIVRFTCNGRAGRYITVLIPNRKAYLSLCEVEVLGSVIGGQIPGGQNIAVKGIATQSSVYDYRGVPEHAIDGNNDANYGGLSCTHTQLEFNPWWRLDLQDSHAISTVVITNRADCCSERLRGVEVWVENSLDNYDVTKSQCTPLDSVDFPGPTVRFSCNEWTARYITIIIPNRKEYLSLCEVEIFCSITGGEIPGGQNIAFKGVATQSSVYDYRGVPEHAIDGNNDANYGGLSCTHTQLELSPWWRLDLQEKHSVNIVIITNRADCCSKRLSGVQVQVGDSFDYYDVSTSQCMPLDSVDFPGPTVRFSCNGRAGRYVTILIPNRKEYLSLCEVEVFGSVIRGQVFGQTNGKISDLIPGAPNIALKGIATQSSLYDYRGAPEHAIDGNVDANYYGLSCSHTQLEFSPFWRVDLLQTYAIYIVVITNRADCCSERLRGVEVEVGDFVNSYDVTIDVCTSWESVEFPEPITYFNCNGRIGSNIKVVIPNRVEYLTLCEVEVYGSVVEFQSAVHSPGGENIALKGTATQSSLHDNGGRPENAIDGNKDAVYGGQSCSHTQIEQNPWWRLDLKEIHAIDIVVITNRNDCCPERLKGVEVWVGSSIDNSGADSFQCIPWELVDFPGPTFHFGCNGKKGRYVTVVIPNREDYLTLCEVEVFSSVGSITESYNLSGESIALNGTATQSSLYDYRGHPENAIDGNKDATYGGQSCSHTQSEHSPWWRLDLKEIHAIDIVVITNRKDCCQKRLRGVEVRVGDFLNNNGADNFQCTPWEPVDFSGPTFHFGCNGKKGRYVTVVIPNREDYLTLCEVEVFGSVTDSHNPDGPNIALKGVATQSSMYDYRGAPEHAIDGNNNSSYGGKSCTHTKLEFSPWWRLDLQENHAINIVIITNRVDCCSERLRGVEVWVGSSPEINDINSFKCTPWTSVEFPKPRLRFSCNGRNVRYITVTIPNRKEYLTLCEVEVFASCPHDLIPDGPNIALKGTATQSSVYKRGGPEHAIDGNKDATYRGLSCTHTKLEFSPWWRLDLLESHAIDTVIITNRADCCSERLRGVEVWVGDSQNNHNITKSHTASSEESVVRFRWEQQRETDIDKRNMNIKGGGEVCIPQDLVDSPGATLRFCCLGKRGRYVTVVIPNRKENLSLCEVEVFGSTG
ncbi:uncharacterized protein LOC102347739 [Latimeria chalumnae]|uniref:uncharacterized protein LOC102347739 n=1 Tax=Latimeria chalumnae TaxID=7897 RepID=UPI0003C18DFA|nr:PREDICTED: uncharacterized protein LOC102347739 [Latimeria chalumnae]|eukprot:XP_006004939.1 PREDICTED: uncharacterized protein LOC102347739 [Latimeria chalumnae]